MKKILLIFITALIITILMPYGGLRSINVTLMQTWDSETVHAPFDIPIQKTQEEIEDEKKSITTLHRPVFTIDTAYVSNLKSQLLTAGRKMDASKVQLKKIAKTVDDIYSVGVISSDNYSLYANKTLYLQLGDVLLTSYTGSLYTPSSAIEYLEKQTPLKVDFMRSFVGANLIYNSQLSKMLENEALEDISITKGVIPRGEILVANGQIIDQQTLLLIDSYNKSLDNNSVQDWVVYLMYAMRFFIVFGILIFHYMFISRFSTHYIELTTTRLTFILLVYVVICALLGLVAKIPEISVYIVPVPIVAIYALTFFNMRVAILVNIVMALFASLFVSNPYEFLFINIASGMMAIFVMRHFYHRSKLIRAVGTIVVTQILLFLTFSLLFSGDILQVDYMPVLWMFVSGLLFLGFYQLVYLLEKIFGFVSDASLLELCDTNQPLLLQLAHNAPGTFQHSVQVSNLAESAAKAIGANPLKARVGGLYHDIGKIQNPFYFVENLSGAFNPHNDCTASRSADIIRQHVVDGMELAKKHQLPLVVQSFIESHHGDSLIYYFYDKARKDSNEGEILEGDYSYPGPRPVSREVSICMMADAVEAASRSLPSYEREDLNRLVDDIVGSQISAGQFATSQLTFEEIGIVKGVLKSKLHRIYHGRIAYPKKG